MASSYNKQFKFIRSDVINICDKITRRLANEARSDMADAANKILDNFYNTYTPHYYVRTHNLYKMITKDKIKRSSGNSHVGSIFVNPSKMFDNYTVTKQFVFDSVWNNAIRGLESQKILEIQNPSKYSGYNWHPTLDVPEVGEIYDDTTPHLLMTKYMDNWYKIGIKKLNDIEHVLGIK